MNNPITKLHLILGICLMILACDHKDNLQITRSINDNWLFKQVADTTWFKATVPGCVHTDLMDNKIIDDPFYRLNERDVQWIDKVDWEYQTNFQIDKNSLDKDVVELVFNGLDTYAKVFLNNNLILEANNMFISWVVDCKDKLVPGENNLRIIFESPINRGLYKRENLGYLLPGAENDQSELGGLGDTKVCVFTRKAGYNFGWDWGPRLVTSGIWQDIELRSWDKARITDINITQNSLSDKSAALKADIEITAYKETQLSVVTQIDNKVAFASKVKVSAGLNYLSFPLEILNPELWWPNGLGDQKLYDIEIKLKDNFNIISSSSATIGLRTIKVIQEPDSIGNSFYFEVNGHPVFMKGANYIPQDVFLPRTKPEDYAKLIKSAADANFNMLRVWGGGIYEKDIFYDLCDESGILVWQDFMFACAMYPGNEEFLANVEKEAIQNVKRLRNHPCIAMWCGDNEILSAWNRWGWKDNVLDNQGPDIADTIWKAYDDVFHNILPQVVKEYDPQRYYWSSSPSSGFGELENGKSGDNHYWGVWWAKEPFSKYEEEIPRFMSEFGFQSFPEFASVKKYTIEEDWDIYSDVMKSHQRSSIGNATIEEYMIRDYKKPMNFEMFLYVGQLLQARGIKIGIEAQRRAMPFCMGSLYWQLNDCWPVASWSGIDYYGNWKALHYSVKEAFKETIISNNIQDNKLEMYIINDKLDNINAVLRLEIMDFYGKVIYQYEDSILVKENSSHIYYREKLETLLGSYNKTMVLLHAQLIDLDSVVIDDNIQYFSLPRQLQLPVSNLSFKISDLGGNKLSLDISTDHLVKNIYVQTPIEGHFSDNYFDLLPHQTKTIEFYSEIDIDSFISEELISIITLTDTYEK